jgi:spermidine synthase
MNKNLAYLIAFITGFSIMLIELIGTRIISPYYGNTIYTWTSLISTALVFIALGYYIGGKIADKYSSYSILYSFLTVSGIFTMLIPKISKFILENTNSLGIRLGSLASSVMLFAIPISALAMATPFILKLSAKNIKDIGVTSGKLYAVSTIGSFFGTILTGFFLIPSYPISQILTVLGLILFIFGIGMLFYLKKARWLVFGLLVLLIPAKSNIQTIYETESFYGNIKVVRENNDVLLLVDGSTQSCINSVSKETCFGYEKVMEEFIDPDDDILIIGLGLGNLAKRFNNVDAVEIDKKIADIAVDSFGYNKNVIVDDGRNYIKKTEKIYDVMIFDAFKGYGIASHLVSKEAFEEAKQKLDGILIVNTLGYKEHKMQRAVYTTLKEVFNHVYVKEYGSVLQNYIFFASDKEIDGDFIDMEEHIVITDDFNPLESYSMEIGEVWRDLNKYLIDKYVI